MGNTQRHRLNHHGDRALNSALHVVANSRMRYDPVTQAFVEERLARGKSKKEVRRTLKRYIARSLYRQLQCYDIEP